MNKKITEVLIWTLLISPFVFIFLFWDQFPDEIPVHWNYKGEPDAYGSKTWGLFILPVTNLFIYGLFKLLPFIDPKKENYALFTGKRRTIQFLLHAFLTTLFFITSLISLGIEVNLNKVIILGVILLLMGIGNYMSNIRQNYFMGVRTPWTLANEEVWRETHRFTAKLWVVASFAALFGFISGLLPDWFIIVYFIFITVIPIAYSYIIYRKLDQSEEVS